LGGGPPPPPNFFWGGAPPPPPSPGSAFANFSLNVFIKMINHVATGVGAVSNAQLCLFHITIGDYIQDIWEKLRTSLRLFVDSLYVQLYRTALNICKFYDHPKIRKKDSPLRPIDSIIGSVMYNTTMFFDKI